MSPPDVPGRDSVVVELSMSVVGAPCTASTMPYDSIDVAESSCESGATRTSPFGGLGGEDGGRAADARAVQHRRLELRPYVKYRVKSEELAAPLTLDVVVNITVEG